MLRNMRKRRVRPSAEISTVRIGKKGVTDSFIEEVSKNLKKKGEVKVRILKTGFGGRTTKEIAEDVAKATNSVIVQIRGHTFMLRKAKSKKRCFVD